MSLPVDVSAALRDRARVEGRTQVDVLLDAVESSVGAGTLAGLVQRRVAQMAAGGLATSGLFVRVARREAGDDATEQYVSLSLRMRVENVDVLDRFAAETGAGSRSLLCAAVLEAWLD